MNRTKRCASVTFTTCLSIVLAASGSHLAIRKASGAGIHQARRTADKVGTGLRKRAFNSSSDDEKVRVVLQLNGEMSDGLNTLLHRSGIRLTKSFKNFNSSAIELPPSVVDELASYQEVDFVTQDEDVMPLGHVTVTTGAEDARGQASGSNGNNSLDGTGIGIAILDSGIYLSHKSLSTRVVHSQDFTGEGRVDDPYGHGTHVASAAAGNGILYNANYAGIAPKANLINLRVLDSHGRGSISKVLSALDWVYSNRTTYNIRVANMSLGAPALSSYKNDPLCLAVRKLVDAGVVVVTAAGNDGKDAFGRKQYGAIHAPGNEPSAITVGATNTFGTNSRADDNVTSYSSRGPTRSFWTDRRGVRHYDNLIKPDLVAPGNKLVFAESANSYLVSNNPGLDTGLGAGRNSQKMMYLSGTSVSAPLVSGAALE